MLPNHLGPLHMSPVYRAGRDEKRLKILGTSFGTKLEKQTKLAKRNRVISFAPIMALATLLAVSLQLNGLLMM